jgi:hypothetical protein
MFEWTVRRTCLIRRYYNKEKKRAESKTWYQAAQ